MRTIHEKLIRPIRSVMNGAPNRVSARNGRDLSKRVMTAMLAVAVVISMTGVLTMPAVTLNKDVAAKQGGIDVYQTQSDQNTKSDQAKNKTTSSDKSQKEDLGASGNDKNDSDKNSKLLLSGSAESKDDADLKSGKDSKDGKESTGGKDDKAAAGSNGSADDKSSAANKQDGDGGSSSDGKGSEGKSESGKSQNGDNASADKNDEGNEADKSGEGKDADKSGSGSNAGETDTDKNAGSGNDAENKNDTGSNDADQADDPDTDSDTSNDKKLAASAPKLITSKTELKYDGDGFTVTAIVDKDSRLPENTKLEVREVVEKLDAANERKLKNGEETKQVTSAAADSGADVYDNVYEDVLKGQEDKKGQDVREGEKNSETASKDEAATKNEAASKDDAEDVVKQSEKKAAEKAKKESAKTNFKYNDYYTEAEKAVKAVKEGAEKEDAQIEFVKLYDISFVANGVEFEPSAPIDVKITYDQAIKVDKTDNVKIVHFGVDKKTGGINSQVLGSDATDITANKIQKGNNAGQFNMTEASFEAESFSVYGVIYTTYAQISTHVITANGEDFVIEVTYGDDAEIPEGAVLEAEEIAAGTDEYEKYLAKSLAAVKKETQEKDIDASSQDLKHGGEDADTGNTEDKDKDASSQDRKDGEEDADSGNTAKNEDADSADASENEMIEDVSIDFARFFDIRIMVDGKKIEPAAPVTVTVTYADAVQMNDGNDLLAVHFGEKGTEVIEASSDDEQKSVVFTQDSFSITGTIITSENQWPGSNGKYFMYVRQGGNYYAVAHDGSLTPVTVNGNKIVFDSSVLINVLDYEWTYQSYTGGAWWNPTTNHYVFYNEGTGDVYLDPSMASGLNDQAAAVALSRNNQGYIGSGNNYIGAQDGAITGKQNQNAAVPVQFASVPRMVTVHFVDRDGNPINGVSYSGSQTDYVTQNADGTYVIPYEWDGHNGSVDFENEFSKTGYTYASTHLAGSRRENNVDVPYTHNGLTIDGKLVERNNALYLYTDCGDQDANPRGNLGYNPLAEYNINGTITVPQKSVNATTKVGTGLYSPSGTDKDIYVIMDPVPTNPSIGSGQNINVPDPAFHKKLVYNEDGTYTLSLDVTGTAKNTTSNPKANVIFIVDTSSSMRKNVNNPNSTSSPTRLEDTKAELADFAEQMLSINVPGGDNSDKIELAMISFDGGVVSNGQWYTTYNGANGFQSQVNTLVPNNMHTGTDWEDALKEAYRLGKAKLSEGEATYVVFFTDGEPSQYTNFNGPGEYSGQNRGYRYWYSCFLSRETANDEARAIVSAGMTLYSIFAYNPISDTYAATGENGSDMLHNLTRYAYNTTEDLTGSRFYYAERTSDLNSAFANILNSINEYVGVTDVEINDDITSLTSTGINLVSSAVGGFTYTRSGGRYGNGTVWEEAPAATHADTTEGDVTSVNWDLGNMILEDGVTYTVSFKVWPSQEAYDWLANLQNGTKTWDDVVAAGLDAPNGSNPQIVKNGNSYSLLTNKPSLNSEDEIINNRIKYTKTHSEIVAPEAIPNGTPMNTPIEGEDEDGNRTITTYTEDQGVYTKTVVTYKETYFKNPDPMPLVPESMNVLKKWETSMNTSHPADELKFRVLVDGKYYQNDGSLVEGEAGQANAKVLPVSAANDWMNSINIATGIVKYFDDDNEPLSEALVLETGHKYTLEEFDLMEGGSAFLYYSSYEFHSQTMRPMIVDGTLKYLVLIDEDNPAPSGADTYVIGEETYYVAASGSGSGTMSGTNYRRAELDITKIILNSSGVELTDEELDAETFTYRVTLRIPDGTDPAGIVGYEYVPRTTSNAYTLYGYQTGETAFESDIDRFSGKTFRAWNTLAYRDLVEWEDVAGRIISKTDEDGNIIWKVPADAEGYHNITYDMTLNRNEVIRFTNLPTGTKYIIQEIYANHYQADRSVNSGGLAPIEMASNIASEGYEIAQVLTTNGTVSANAVANDTVSGTIDTPNVRYYNQFTNDLKSVKVKVTILKTNQDGSMPLSGAVFDLYDEAGYEADPQKAMQTGLTSSSEAGKEGTIDLGTLADGIYYLVETSAPAGYIPLTDPVTITVSHGQVTYSQENSTLDDDGTGITVDSQGGYQLTVINDEGVALPNSGGPGTTWLYLLGSILMIVSGIALAARRRNSSFLPKA